jgi:hypothetical protein
MQRICTWKVPFFGTALKERISGEILYFARRLQCIIAYYSRRFINRFTRAIRKITSGELLAKQAMKKCITCKNTRTYLSYVVNDGFEAFVVLGNKFLYACVKKIVLRNSEKLRRAIHNKRRGMLISMKMRVRLQQCSHSSTAGAF